MIGWIMQKTISLTIRVFEYLHPAMAQRLKFFRLYKEPMNVKEPRLFAEKIIVRMNSKDFEKFSEYADKWKVREYVAKVIGEEYLLPLLGVYDRPRNVNYDEIPEGAYLKLNHGSGYNIVFEKARIQEVKRKIDKWFREDYSKKACERQYKNIQRKILIEKNLAPNGERLWEFSFFVFHGKTEFTQIRDNAHHRFEVGRSYETLPFQLYSTVTETEPMAPEYSCMIEMAEKLAQPFSFVRVDFLMVDHRIYFGELTFSPGAGMKKFKPYEYNIIFGDKMGL